MAKKPVSIELRLIKAEDSKLLFELKTSQKCLEYIGDKGINTQADAEEYIRKKMNPEISIKGFVNHIILDSNTGEEVGTCSLHDRPGEEGIDVGYAILPQFEGKGYATKAAKKMVELAFNTLNIDFISAITTDENIGSIRVLEKLGFQHKGYIQLPDSKEKIRLYTLRKSFE